MRCYCRGSIPLSEDSTRGLRHHPVIFGRPSTVPMAGTCYGMTKTKVGATSARVRRRIPLR
jgi:hypothetical protein